MLWYRSRSSRNPLPTTHAQATCLLNARADANAKNAVGTHICIAGTLLR
jgi:hypothetical protein